MSCKSALYCVNTSNPTLAEGSSIPLGTTVRRFGPNLRTDGAGILVQGAGYYDIDCSFTITPAATGIVTVQLYQDGVAIPGATASATVAAVDTAVVLSFPAIIRLFGCNCTQESSVLEFRLNENSGVLNNGAVAAERI